MNAHMHDGSSDLLTVTMMTLLQNQQRTRQYFTHSHLIVSTEENPGEKTNQSFDIEALIHDFKEVTVLQCSCYSLFIS